MTLILITESHGEVDSGYFSVFTQMARLGEYTFVTRHFCELARRFAEKPRARKGRILSYSLERFWDRFGEQAGDIFQILEESKTEKEFGSKIDTYFDRQQGRASLEDEVNLKNRAHIIPVTVGDHGENIQIGVYNIAAHHFGVMAWYLSRGGWLGWSGNSKPNYAEATIEAIKKSEHPLYRPVKEWLSKGKK